VVRAKAELKANQPIMIRSTGTHMTTHMTTHTIINTIKLMHMIIAMRPDKIIHTITVMHMSTTTKVKICTTAMDRHAPMHQA
jgi:hypothetical protein